MPTSHRRLPLQQVPRHSALPVLRLRGQGAEAEALASESASVAAVCGCESAYAVGGVVVAEGFGWSHGAGLKGGECGVVKRIQIVVSQEPGEVVNRLNDMFLDGWKIQSETVLACSWGRVQGSHNEILVPTWVYVLYKENSQ